MSFVFVQVLRIDIKAQKAELVGPVLDGVDSQKFISGSVCGPDGCLYFIPCRESQVLKLDPAKGSFTKIGQEFARGNNKWDSGVLGPDGRIYGLPNDGNKVRSPQQQGCGAQD